MLVQPILYNIAAFDASNIQTFKFFVNGGDRVKSNKLIIKTNDANPTVVYEHTVTTFSLENIYDPNDADYPNALSNGEYYQAIVITYNDDNGGGDSSVESLPIQFYCYTQPVFNFINLPTGNIIEGSNYTFEVQYHQSEGEPLSQYNFSLYDTSNNLVATSGAVYTGDDSGDLVISYTFDGFLNGERYKLIVAGQTAENTLISTPDIFIDIAYNIPEIFSPMYVTNNCDGGYISVQSNLILLDGVYDGEQPTYIDNSAIDLSNSEDSVTWNQNYTIPDDFSVVVWGYNFINGEDIIILKNDSGDTIRIKYMEDNGECWFELFAYHNIDSETHLYYEIMSNILMLPASSYNIQMAFRCVGGLYDIWCNITE